MLQCAMQGLLSVAAWYSVAQPNGLGSSAEAYPTLLQDGHVAVSALTSTKLAVLAWLLWLSLDDITVRCSASRPGT